MELEHQERQILSNDQEEQLVIFKLGEESYGVSIEAVNTIIRLPDITCVPHTADYVRGVINLRGVIVPVIDLRRRFGLECGEASKATRVVVVENVGMMVGMVVDAVTETLRLPVANIESLSELVQSVDSRYLRGVGKYDDRLIILLSIDKVLADHETDALREIVRDNRVDESALAVAVA